MGCIAISAAAQQCPSFKYDLRILQQNHSKSKAGHLRPLNNLPSLHPLVVFVCMPIGWASQLLEAQGLLVAQFDDILSLNLKSSFYILRSSVKNMMKTGGGSIVFTTSAGNFCLLSNEKNAVPMPAVAGSRSFLVCSERGPCSSSMRLGYWTRIINPHSSSFGLVITNRGCPAGLGSP